MNLLSDIFDKPPRFDPERIAIIDPGNCAVSYRKLGERVEQLSVQLREAGVADGFAVGLCLPKNDASVVAVFSILGAGAAYVPVDSYSPVTRIATIFGDCRVAAIFVESDRVEEISNQLPCRIDILPCCEPGLALLKCNWRDKSAPSYAENLAIILYTSGSTGIPKGVQITHRNVLAFVEWCLESFEYEEPGVCAAIAPFQFDLSLFDLFVSLYRGACILLLDQKICQNPMMVASYFEQYRVSVCYATPTMLSMLLRFGRLHKTNLSALKLVLFAGEVFPIEALRQLQAQWSHARFYNLYGPTETNVVTYHPIPDRIDPERRHPFPIGRPCSHVQYLLATDEGVLEPVENMQGELLISGPSVTPGYYNAPELNDGAFVPGPNGRRYYCTGDLVQFGASGVLQFLGRRDRMIKRKGYRIEPEEIERVLGLHTTISEAAVISEQSDADVIIKAFLVAVESGAVTKRAEMNRHCLGHLPTYFLPDKYIFVGELPQTSTGKIDYQRLKGNDQ
jgi:amino acid adenylation domain-containing protein